MECGASCVGGLETTNILNTLDTRAARAPNLNTETIVTSSISAKINTQRAKELSVQYGGIWKEMQESHQQTVAKLHQVECDKEDLECERDQLKKENLELKEKFRSTLTSLTETECYHLESQQIIEQIRVEKEGLQQRIVAFEAHQIWLDQQGRRSQRDLKAVQQQLSAANDKIAALEAKNNDLVRLLRAGDAARVELTSQVDEGEKQRAILAKEGETLQRALASKNQLYQAVIAEKNALKAELSQRSIGGKERPASQQRGVSRLKSVSVKTTDQVSNNGIVKNIEEETPVKSELSENDMGRDLLVFEQSPSGVDELKSPSAVVVPVALDLLDDPPKNPWAATVRPLSSQSGESRSKGQLARRLSYRKAGPPPQPQTKWKANKDRRQQAIVGGGQEELRPFIE